VNFLVDCTLLCVLVKMMCIAVHVNASASYNVSRAVGNHTVLPAGRHQWTHPTVTPARQAGTWFAYHRGIEGWVDLGGDCFAQMVKLFANSHPSMLGIEQLHWSLTTTANQHLCICCYECKLRKGWKKSADMSCSHPPDLEHLSWKLAQQLLLLWITFTQNSVFLKLFVF